MDNVPRVSNLMLYPMNMLQQSGSTRILTFQPANYFSCYHRKTSYKQTYRYNSHSKFSHDSPYNQRSTPSNDPVFSVANCITDRSNCSNHNREIPVLEQTMIPGEPVQQPYQSAGCEFYGQPANGKWIRFRRVSGSIHRFAIPLELVIWRWCILIKPEPGPLLHVTGIVCGQPDCCWTRRSEI